MLSDIALPARIQLTHDSECPADVTLRQADVPDQIDNVSHRGANWAASAHEFLLNIPEVGRFLAAGGRHITMCPAPTVPIEDILVFATGTAMGALLYQRGAMLLHGSAVIYKGRAFVFCGPSGAGKSTLAAALVRSGCELLADDISSIELADNGVPYVQADGRFLRLYPDSIDNTGMADGIGARVRLNIDKFHVTPPTGRHERIEGVPLGAIYMLAESNAAIDPHIGRMSLVSAAQSLLRQSYRRRIALAYSSEGQLARRTSAILSRSGVYLLTRPRDFALLDKTVEQLRIHWDQLG